MRKPSQFLYEKISLLEYSIIRTKEKLVNKIGVIFFALSSMTPLFLHTSNLIVVGGYTISLSFESFPLAYIAEGTTITPINLNLGTDQGKIFSVAINPNGLIVLGGQDYTNNSPLVYSASNDTATSINNLSIQSTIIRSVAINSYESGSGVSGSEILGKGSSSTGSSGNGQPN